MEKDNEAKGVGNSYDFGARIYDSRLGRWMSLDPLMAKYPDLSAYNFVGNSPLIFIDKDGQDLIIYLTNEKGDKQSKPALVIKSDKFNNTVNWPLIPGSTDVKKYEVPTTEIDIKQIEQALTSDAYMVNFGAGFAFVGGGTIGGQIVWVNSGADQGVYFYVGGGVQLGYDVGVSVTAGQIDFKENNSANSVISRTSFEGKSQGNSLGAFGKVVQTVKSYTDGEYCTDPTGSTCSDILYDGNLIGVGAGAKNLVGYTYYFTESSLLNKLSIPITPTVKRAEPLGPPAPPPSQPTQSQQAAPSQQSDSNSESATNQPE